MGRKEELVTDAEEKEHDQQKAWNPQKPQQGIDANGLACDLSTTNIIFVSKHHGWLPPE